MKKIKYILKTFTGGQDLTPRQRLIGMWWATSLSMTCMCAESIPALLFFVANFGISSHYLEKYVPVPEDDSDPFDDEFE